MSQDNDISPILSTTTENLLAKVDQWHTNQSQYRWDIPLLATQYVLLFVFVLMWAWLSFQQITSMFCVAVMGVSNALYVGKTWWERHCRMKTRTSVAQKMKDLIVAEDWHNPLLTTLWANPSQWTLLDDDETAALDERMRISHVETKNIWHTVRNRNIPLRRRHQEYLHFHDETTRRQKDTVGTQDINDLVELPQDTGIVVRSLVWNMQQSPQMHGVGSSSQQQFPNI